MDDLISRRDAIEIVMGIGRRTSIYAFRCKGALERLPSVQLVWKKGKWNWIGFNIECSVCGAMPNFDSTEPLYNYCPNCGADMRGDSHGKD